MSDTIQHENHIEYMTAEMFGAWLDTSWAGERIVYHVGYLAADRYKPVKGEGFVTITSVDRMANAAWKAYEAGLVCLVQRRVLGETHYIAVKRARSKQK